MSRLFGVKKTLPITVAAVVLVAGCGGHDKNAAAHSKSGKPSAPAPAKTSCAPADDSCIPPDHPSGSPIAVPVAEVGKPLNLQLPTSNGIAQVQLTLTGLKVKPRTSQDPKGTQEVCYGYTLKNTGSVAWSKDDTTSGISWTWFGLDGEMAEPGPGTSDVCDELGRQWAGGDQPAPLPGHFVQGYQSFTVPTRPGAVEVTGSDGSPLFRLNYEPRSAQVQIDARGQ